MRQSNLRRRRRQKQLSSIAVIVACLLTLRWENTEIIVQHNSHTDGRTVRNSPYKNPRPWPIVSDTKWCRRPPEKDAPSLIYVKIPKTGSSTLVGINIRIAHKVGARQSNTHYGWTVAREHACSFSYVHGRSELLGRQKPYILWSFLRDPAARAVSEFYHFEVSRKGRPPTDIRTREFLKLRKNYQFEYLADHPDPRSLLQPNFPQFKEANDIIQRYILEPYHFIGILERKFESLATMKLLWGLKTEDLIVLDSKRSGGYDDGRFNGSCIWIQVPTDLPAPFLQSYTTNQFPENNLDYLLYDVVNRTLDKTIQSLGVGAIEHEMKELKKLQVMAEENCQAKAVFPCSANGTLQLEAASKNCYWTDSGCGYACVDQVLDAAGS